MLLVTERQLNEADLPSLPFDTEAVMVMRTTNIEENARRIKYLTTSLPTLTWDKDEFWVTSRFVLDILNPQLLHETASRLLKDGIVWGYVKLGSNTLDISLFIHFIRNGHCDLYSGDL